MGGEAMAKDQGKTLTPIPKVSTWTGKAVAAAGNALRVAMTVLRSRRRIVFAVAGVLVFLLAGAWWWRHPTRPALLSDKEIFQKQQQAAEKAAKKDTALVRKKDAEIVALKQKLAAATAEAEARAEKPLQAAFTAGPDAIAKYASEMWRPGSLEALKASRKPQEGPQ